MRDNFLFFITIFFLISCTKQPKYEVDTTGIEISLEVKRFDIDFYTENNESLEGLKREYPVLFPTDVPDSIWLKRIHNSKEQELFKEVQKVYADITPVKNDLIYLFQHVKYYRPNYVIPTIYCILNNIDYEYRTVYKEDVFISLDVYLGKDHPFYGDYPGYIKENNTQDRILVDVANQIINSQIRPSNDRSFLAKMIYEGKKMYMLDAYLPKLSDQLKIGYTQEKLEWAKANEEEIWKYFIENDLLYSTDTKLNKRFLDNAPFSKFYLTEDNNSPGRIGAWIGWQIVRAYMEKNDVSLQSLLTTKTEEIFKKSTYKPRK